MPTRLIVSILFAAAISIPPRSAFSQADHPPVVTDAPKPAAQAFNPRDLSGIWVRGKAPRGNAPLSPNRPPFTPWGQAKFNTVKGSWSYSKTPGLAPPI